MLAGLPSALSYSGIQLTVAGANVLDLMDDAAGTFGIILTGILTSLTFSWGLDRQVIEAGTGSENPVVRWIVPLCRYVIPMVLVIVLVITILTGSY